MRIRIFFSIYLSLNQLILLTYCNVESRAIEMDDRYIDDRFKFQFQKFLINIILFKELLSILLMGNGLFHFMHRNFIYKIP
jgi:hypothetical protein